MEVFCQWKKILCEDTTPADLTVLYQTHRSYLDPQDIPRLKSQFQTEETQHLKQKQLNQEVN